MSGEDRNYLFDFQPTYEFVSFELGNVFGSGRNFILDITGLAVGESFDIFFTAVPTPAAFALFGLGFGALALRRR